MNRQTIAALIVCGIVSVAVGSADAATLHLNMGETGGPDQETVAGEIWNTLIGGGTDATLQYADGSAATGVTATQAGSGSNPADGAGNGYISAQMDTVTQSIVFSSGATTTTLVIGGLAPSSTWAAHVFAGLNGDARTQDITVNGNTQSALGFGAVHASHVPVVFGTVVADGGGNVTVTASNGNSGSIEFLGAVSLRQVAALASGTKIGLDIGPTGTANWNNFAFNSTKVAGSVIDLTGKVVNGVSVSVTGAAGFNNDGTDNWIGLSTNSGGAPAEFIDAVTTDIAFATNVAGITVTISGLDNALLYNIDAVSVAVGTATEVLTINGVDSSQFTRADARDNGAFHSFDLIAPVAGVITLQFTQAAGGGNAIVNGILLEAVAVPAPAALPAGLAMVALAAVRRRR